MSTQANDTPASSSTAIPPGAQSVLALFEGDLAEVRFPDVDEALLQEAAARVREKAEAQARAEAALRAAREELVAAQDALLQKCQRGLAYARVYAEEDPDLTRRLEGITVPRSVLRAVAPQPALAEEGRPARRNRRASDRTPPALFIEAPAESANQEAA